MAILQSRGHSSWNSGETSERHSDAEVQHELCCLLANNIEPAADIVESDYRSYGGALSMRSSHEPLMNVRDAFSLCWSKKAGPELHHVEVGYELVLAEEDWE